MKNKVEEVVANTRNFMNVESPYDAVAANSCYLLLVIKVLNTV